MKHEAIDTNVIVRFLVESPDEVEAKFKGVYAFFAKLEKGELRAELPELVLFQAYFVLTSFYEVPRADAAEKLERLIRFKGLHITEKDVVAASLARVQAESVDIVDAYILAWSKQHNLDGVYSFDEDLRKKGLKLLRIC